METIDVVIPTVGRPSLRRAVESAKSQTQVRVRLHVVLDDPTREAALRSFLGDHEIIVTRGGVGGAQARNMGLRESGGRWVAYLDDDDWWEQSKLLTQVEAMVAGGAGIGLCGAVFHESGGGTRVLPRSEPVADSFADYIVTRPDLTYGRSLVQSSCLIVDRERTPNVEWDPSLPKHQDWDYALRLVRDGAALDFVNIPLVHIRQGSSGSVSNVRAWDASRKWYERHSAELTARGRGDFLAAHVLRSALASRSVEGLRYAATNLLHCRPHFAALIVGLSGIRDGLSSSSKADVPAR